jgi:hypothetical protein
MLIKDLNFIMRNQRHFTRPADRSIHGWVRIDCPSEADRKDAAIGSRAARTDSTGGAGHDDDLAVDVAPETL